ncbi:aminoglycoside 6-adenylyltransferase [Kineococcus sp. R86509]|uniref:aminoglycoside 6-adenylyltransferase n=1 Tax=Kineococcus sp. R86509 TaxID=3093851 RepID=UPI0036D31FE3
MDYDDVLDRLTRWAGDDPNVRALLLTGSAAAGATHRLSDRDLEVYVDDPTPLLADDAWWSELGEVLVVERLHAPGWYPSRIVYYAGGKLDLTVLPVGELTAVVRDRPFTVLVDADGLAAGLEPSPPLLEPPSAADVEQALNWGYAAALMCAKAVVRDEPWSAKIRDRDLKEQLLRLVEWDHRARYGAAVDVRFLGSRMREWMDPGVQRELEDCWGRFDGADTARALRACVRLFARLAQRLAARWDLEPFDHQRLHAEIEAILDQGLSCGS